MGTIRVEPFFSPPTVTSFVRGVSWAAGFSDFFCPLWSPRLAKTCERERRPTWDEIVLLRAICSRGIDDQPQAHPIRCKPIHRESRRVNIRSTPQRVHTTSRMTLEIYNGMETGLTASATVVLMSCTVVDGGVSIVSATARHLPTTRSRSQIR